MSATRLATTFTRSLRTAAPRPSPSASHLPLAFLAPSWSSRPFTSSLSRPDAPPSAPSLPSPGVSASHEVEVGKGRTAIGRVERRLQITFTCTAAVPIDGRSVAEILPGEEVDGKQCGHRSTHEFSRRSYEKGIVLIECPGCKNRHLIGKQPFVSSAVRFRADRW